MITFTGKEPVMPNQLPCFLPALDARGIVYKTNLEMSGYTTFRIGGTAAIAVFPETEGALLDTVALCRESGVVCALVGNGSNLLWDDGAFAGCVIFTTALRDIRVDGCHMTASAGAALSALTVAARDAGLGGMSFAYGIPGTVGGAVYMNAGAYDGEIGDCIESVTVYDIETGEILTYPRTQCGFAYRTSGFQSRRSVILHAVFSLTPKPTAEIRAEMDAFLTRRRDKQPLNYPSAGSAFKRYPGYFTAKLIDDAGLKGYSVGGAQVSEKHAGFIVNRGGATAEDVRSLLAYIRETIYEKHGIRIETEIRTKEDCII